MRTTKKIIDQHETIVLICQNSDIIQFAGYIEPDGLRIPMGDIDILLCRTEYQHVGGYVRIKDKNIIDKIMRC